MKTRSYGDFSASLHGSAVRNAVPLRVMVELTYRCNFRCPHCYVPSDYGRRYHQKEMTTQEVFFLLEGLKALGCFYLGFTGGEPFLRKDILKILRYAVRLGFEIIVYTNGSLIDAKKAKALGRMRLNKIDITLPGWTEGVFDAVTGAEGSRRKVYRAIDLLLKNRVPVEFKTCLVDVNRREVSKIRAFARSHRARLRLSDRLHVRLGESKVSRSQSLKVSSGKRSSAIGRRSSAFDLFSCGAGRTQAAVTPSGELKLCLLLDAEKIPVFETSLPAAWQRLVQWTRGLKVDRKFHCPACSVAPSSCLS